MVKPSRGPARKKENLLRREGVSTVDWKDVALLRKFVSDRGKIRARRVTGLTPRQQKQVAKAIKNAREMALLPYPGPAKS
jgi:small subunit ribosomal protein S18